MTASQIVKRLWQIRGQQALDYTRERFDEQQQLERLALDIPGWNGRHNRTFLIPGVPDQACQFSRVPGTTLHFFVAIENPEEIGIAGTCSKCDSVLPAVSNAACYSCALDAWDMGASATQAVS